MGLLRLIALIEILLCTVACAQPKRPDPHPADESHKATLEISKLQYEVDKLRAEVDELSLESQESVLGRRWVSAIGPMLGAIIGAIGAWIVWWTSHRLTQNQADKLDQEREQDEESHLVALFRDLSNDKVALRVAAIELLLSRYSSLAHLQRASVEAKLLIRVLLATNKLEENPLAQKHLGDRLPSVLGATLNQDGSPRYPTSPLTAFDLQNVRLQDAWWPRVDIRGVDFYSSELQSLAIEGAIADDRTVFADANLRRATLTSGQFRGTNMKGANLEQAYARNASFRGTDFRGANLTGADFSGSDLAGAKLDGAIRSVDDQAFEGWSLELIEGESHRGRLRRVEGP